MSGMFGNGSLIYGANLILLIPEDLLRKLVILKAAFFVEVAGILTQIHVELYILPISILKVLSGLWDFVRFFLKKDNLLVYFNILIFNGIIK